MRVHQHKRYRGFDRVTLSNHQTIRGVTLREDGIPLDTRGDAGPAWNDYSAWFNALNPTIDASGNPTGITRKDTRELSFVIADGRYMGPVLPENLSVPGDSYGQGFMTYAGSNYVVFRNLSWDIEVLNLHHSMADMYVEFLDENGFITFPASNETFESYLDSLYEPVGEGTVQNDVWGGSPEIYEHSIATSLIRCPLLETNETVVDMSGSDGDGRSEMMLGTLGMLNADYYNDHGDVPDPMSKMLGVDPADQFWEKMYRPNEPYDRLRGVILARDVKQYPFYRSGGEENQVSQSLDTDEALDDGFEFTGNTHYWNFAQAPRRIRIRGSFKGDIVVSAKKQWPLVLTVATLPSKVRTLSGAGGTGEDYGVFYRGRLFPVRWNITANIKQG